MSVYYPDQWVLVEVKGTDPHYRVFGSWRGGFASGDAWRLNSGIYRVRMNDDNPDLFEFHGHSGSIYYGNRNTYGLSHMGMYNIGELERITHDKNLIEYIAEIPSDEFMLNLGEENEKS
jgi:hypothetical protein